MRNLWIIISAISENHSITDIFYQVVDAKWNWKWAKDSMHLVGVKTNKIRLHIGVISMVKFFKIWSFGRNFSIFHIIFFRVFNILCLSCLWNGKLIYEDVCAISAKPIMSFSMFTTLIITIVENHLIYWIVIIDRRCNNVWRCNIWCPQPISEQYVHCTSLMRPTTTPIFSFFPDRLYSRYLDIGQLE